MDMALRACKYYCYKALLRQKNWLAMLLALSVMYMFATPMRDVCENSGLTASILPFFVFIGNNYLASGILLCIWVWIIENVPYRDASEDMIMIRCSHSAHVFGVTLHITALSLLYWLMILIYSILVLIPYVVSDFGWGTLYMALNRGAGNNLIGMGFVFSKKLQQLLTPTEAIIMSWALHFLVSVFLGLVVYLVNSRERYVGGSIFALMLIIFDYCFHGLGMPYIVYYFSPVSWSNLNTLDMTKTTPLPSVSYAYIGLLTLCALMVVRLLLHRGSVLGKGGKAIEYYAKS